MFCITTDTLQENGVELVIFEDKKWLNEKHIEKELGHSNLAAITLKYPKYLRKERQELQNCGKYQPCRKILREDFEIQIIMDCRTAPAVDFKRRLGFKQYDPIMTQEQSVLTQLHTFFKTEDKLFQHNVLRYRIDLYVPKYRLAIEVDELGHFARDIKSEIERQNKIEKELHCEFIRIDPSRKNFDIIDKFFKTKKHIIKSNQQKKVQKTKFQMYYKT